MIWLPSFKLHLSDKQWTLVTRSLIEIMCTTDISFEQMPGRMQYQRPTVVVTLDDEDRFKEFMRRALMIVGRDYFKFELIEKTESFVKLQTEFSYPNVFSCEFYD